jgi:fatty-acyl-CoA synthase
MPSSTPRTTKFSRTVTTIADIVALERAPYDGLIPARNLYQLFEATAELHPERPALTVMLAGDPDVSAVTLSHRGLLDEITRSANLFRSLGVSQPGGAVAFLCPALVQMPPALLGAQVAGVASTINFLLNADAIVDLLIAEQATVLVIPSEADDAALWAKATRSSTGCRRCNGYWSSAARAILAAGLSAWMKACWRKTRRLTLSSRRTATPCARSSIPAARPDVRSLSA